MDIVYRELGDEGILYDSGTSTAHVMNATSGLIWNCCDGRHDAREITEEVLRRYKVERKVAQSDVEQTLNQFKKLQLIRG